MTDFNLDFSRVVTAAVGALLLSTACVGAAVAPAHAVESGVSVQLTGTEAAGATQA